MNAIESVERSQLVERPRMKSGDTVRVHVKVREGDKERVQVFEGIVIGQHRGGLRASFTVRKVSFGQGVERIFPLHSPVIQKVEIVRSARVRRAKLYFLRDLKGKAARMKETKRVVTAVGSRLGGRPTRPRGAALGAAHGRKRARRLGLVHVAGVDEVGRGCLAGPVVAAAVVLDPARAHRRACATPSSCRPMSGRCCTTLITGRAIGLGGGRRSRPTRSIASTSTARR